MASCGSDGDGAMTDVRDITGIYDADGGVRGELTYVVGHLLGTAECGLCDISHGRVRRKKSWDAMVARLEVPVILKHRNEIDATERRAVDGTGLPVVLGRLADGSRVQLLGPDALRVAEGSVDTFEELLRAALDGRA